MTHTNRWIGPVLFASCLLAIACGPKPPPAGGHQAGGQGQMDEPLEEAVDPEVEARIEKIEALVNELNEAIDKQDAEKFWSAFTNETRDLFYKVAQLDMAIAGIKDKSPAEHVLQQQKDFNVVYTIENLDAEKMTATLVGVLRDSGDEVRFPMAFVEQDDGILVDYTDVLTERLDNLKAARMRSLVEDLNRAVADADVELFSSILTDTTLEGCPTFLHDVPAKGKKPPKVESVLKAMKSAEIVVEIMEMDAGALSADVRTTVKGEAGKDLELKFVFEEEAMRIDASGGCAETSE